MPHLSQRLSATLLILLTLGACSDKSQPGASGTAPSAKPAPRETQGAAADKRTQTLAYEHAIQIDAEEPKVAALHEAARAACQQDVENQCVVLQSNLSTGRAASATLRLRAKAAGIRQIIALLAKQGEITSQSTRADDLAGPLEDSAKKLAMLGDYRTRLEGLRERASSNIDALIKVNKELAEVQGQIEAMTGERARMVQRVETEILGIGISSIQHRSFWKPVAAAFANFGTDFSTALSATITTVAYVIPFGIAFLLFGWGLAKLWRRWRGPRKSA